MLFLHLASGMFRSENLLGSRSTRVEAVKGTGKFSIHWLADNGLKTVESLLLKGVAVFFVFTKWNVMSLRVLNGLVSCP